MNSVHVPLISAALLCTALFSCKCQANSTLYDGVVLNLEGRPCFSIDPDHKSLTPRFASINVSDIAEGKLVWSEHTAQTQTPILLSPPGACIAYGTRFAGEDAVQPLQPKHRYLVSLSVDIRRHGQLENRKYIAYFCVIAAGAARKVLQVRFDEERKEWEWSVCTRS